MPIFCTPETQMFWGIVRNIPLAFSSFARSQVAGWKTTGRHERPRGTLQEWVRKTAHFGGICTRQRTQVIASFCSSDLANAAGPCAFRRIIWRDC